MKAFIVMPDLPPTSGVPASAPGLRAFGLHQGFQSQGLDSSMLLADDVLEERRRHAGIDREASLPPGLITVSRAELLDIAGGAHDAVFVFNALNYVPVRRHLHPSCVLVADFIADLRLERPAAGEARWRRWLGRNRQRRWTRAYGRSLSDADIVTVNGRNKVATTLNEVAGLDAESVVVVPFSLDCRPLLPRHSAPQPAGSAGLRIFVGGFLQPWQRLGSWPAALAHLLGDHATAERLRCRVHLVPTAEHEDLAEVASLSRFPGVTVTTERIPFARYLAELLQSDVVIDLHQPTIERSFAMPTRAVVALCAGLPVIHQRETELSDLLVEYSAGFVVDPEDQQQIEAVLLHLLQRPEALAAVRAGVQRLRDAVLNPAAAIDELVGRLNRR